MWILQKDTVKLTILESITGRNCAEIRRMVTNYKGYGSQIRNLIHQGRLLPIRCIVIRFVSISSELGICTVVGLNGTLVEAKLVYMTDSGQ
jgi:hypothetical protein